MHHLFNHDGWVLGILRQRWFEAIDRRKIQVRKERRREQLEYTTWDWDYERGCFMRQPSYAVIERITESAYDGYMDYIDRTREHRFTVWLEDA